MTVRIDTGKGIKTGIPGTATVYTTTAVDYNGTNSDVRKTTALTGVTDTAAGILSFWFKIGSASTDADNMEMFNSGNPPASCMVRRVGTGVGAGELRIIFEDGTIPTEIGDGITTSVFLKADTAWHHFLMNWDYSGANGVVNVYIDDASESITWATNPSAHSATVVGWQNNDTGGTGYGNTPSGITKFEGCMADFYLHTTANLDITNSAARRLFIDSTGNPVDLGENGESPTSSIPIVFLKGGATTWGTNLGTGGDMTNNANITDCADSPSD